MQLSAQITGIDQIEGKLRNLQSRGIDRIAKSCLSAGLTVLAREMRKRAPVGKTGAVRASVGRRLLRGRRSGVFAAKAGINVGKTSVKRPVKRAPHAHLVALGTKPRTRKKIGGRFAYITNPTAKQLSTGSMPPNPFVKIASLASVSAIEAAMTQRAEKRLAIELAR